MGRERRRAHALQAVRVDAAVARLSMADDPPKLPADVIELLEKMATQLPLLPNNDEASRRFEWLLDALIWRGQVPDSFRRLAKRIQADRGIKIRLSTGDAKYSGESPYRDSATRLN